MSGKTTMKMYALWAIAYLPELNYRRDYDEKTGVSRPKSFDPKDGDTKTLINSMYERGGFDNLQYHAIVGPITEVQAKQWSDYLHTRWEKLKADDKESHTKDTQAALIGFEDIFLKDAKKGVFHKPEVLGCTGNRRARCLEEAYVRFVRNDRPKDNPISLDISAAYQEFKDDGERFLVQLAENNTKTEGFKRTTEREDLDGIRKNLAVGRISYASLRQTYPVGTAQKYTYFLKMDAKFPKLKLYERLWLPADNARAILINKLRQGPGIGPVIRSDSDPNVLKDYKAKNKGNDKVQEWTPMSEKDVDVYYTTTIRDSGAGNASPVMAKPNIQTLEEQNQNPIIKAVAKAILKNDSGLLDLLLPLLESSKALVVLAEKSEFETVEKFLTVFANASDDVRAKHVDNLFKFCQAVEKASKAEAEAAAEAAAKAEEAAAKAEEAAAKAEEAAAKKSEKVKS